jgi:peptidoglycan/xylan/chitin deacetylase (PgdA/CDA1 family)
MKFLWAAAAVALVAVPLALASPEGPGYRRPHVPLEAEQHRAIAAAFRRGGPVYCGGGHAPVVALTFDDGPGPYTEQLLAELRTGRAHATFFLVGNRIQYWPRLPREETRLGVIGNHTWSHPHLTALPPWLVWLELARTQFSAKQELGWKPRLFRAPYEQHDRAVDAIAHGLGLLQVLWSVDSGDSGYGSTTAHIVKTVVAGLQPGAIVLMHDIDRKTVRAVPQILLAMRLRGLRAVSVPELLALDPPGPARTHCHVPRAIG